MSHAEFVEGYRSGQLEARVDKVMARKLVKTGVVAAKYRVLTQFWDWLWLLSIPFAIACLVWAKWWIALIVLVVGVLLPLAVKQSAYAFVLVRALEDEQFFKAATEAKALLISARS